MKPTDSAFATLPPPFRNFRPKALVFKLLGQDPSDSVTHFDFSFPTPRYATDNIEVLAAARTATIFPLAAAPSAAYAHCATDRYCNHRQATNPVPLAEPQSGDASSNDEADDDEPLSLGRGPASPNIDSDDPQQQEGPANRADRRAVQRNKKKKQKRQQYQQQERTYSTRV